MSETIKKHPLQAIIESKSAELRHEFMEVQPYIVPGGKPGILRLSVAMPINKFGRFMTFMFDRMMDASESEEIKIEDLVRARSALEKCKFDTNQYNLIVHFPGVDWVESDESDDDSDDE